MHVMLEADTRLFCDIPEKFVKGSGAGGQKINKTSNRVILIHTPTKLRVECQDTRSLQQNRKIARKRLRLKLDAMINGEASREVQKAKKAVTKKAKNKARSKRRRQQKNKKQDEEET
jgi:protein subunit release factor B